jgi:hypothetical protein
MVKYRQQNDGVGMKNLQLVKIQNYSSLVIPNLIGNPSPIHHLKAANFYAK